MASTSRDEFEKLDITEEEIKNITNALKDEKFRKMFVEYAEEISNPENRKLYEQEIAQLENERGMNVQFIHPKPGHVLKTSVDGSKKAFINICQNDKVAKPTSEKKIGPNGVRGLNWSIPHSQTPPREDLDKAGKTCLIFDVVFHPDTYRMGESNARFKQLIEDTALDGVESQFGVKLDRKNVKRPKLQYKGIPTASVIRTKTNDGEAERNEPDENDPLKNMPYPYDNITSEEKAKQLADEVKRKAEKKTENTTFKTPRTEQSVTEPKYTITHRSDMDIQEFRNAPDARSNTRPKELIVKVELPLLSSAGQVDLDVFEQKLQLESTKPAAYKLDIRLPYPVDDDQGSAKFDKSKRCLIITLPVLPAQDIKLPSFVDELSDMKDPTISDPGHPDLKGDEQNVISPLIQEISDSSDQVKSDVIMSEKKAIPSNVHKPTILYSLPEFTFNQDGETVSFVLNVKNVSSDSVSKTFPSSSVCDLKFLSIGSGGFPVHYRAMFKFEEGCCIVVEHTTVDVSDGNVVLVLLKDRSCRGTWNRFEVGLTEEDMKEYLFVTEDNIEMELQKLEEDALSFKEEEQTRCVPSSTLQVTEMNQKKLTIEIKPKKKRATFLVGDEPIDLDDEADTEDVPSSAEIKVVHDKMLPNLHGILKQRSMSESSDDYSNSFNGSCSPGSPREDLLNGLKKSVSFNDRIDSTTFKPGTSVTTMTKTLKNKRRRNRKKDERRKRNNSGGSEGSSSDDIDLRPGSDSHSEGNESDHAEEDGVSSKDVSKESNGDQDSAKSSKKKKCKKGKHEATKEEIMDNILHDLIEEDDSACPELEDIPATVVSDGQELKDFNREEECPELEEIQGVEYTCDKKNLNMEEECPDLEEIQGVDYTCDQKAVEDVQCLEKSDGVSDSGDTSHKTENELSEKVRTKLNIPRVEGKCDSDDDDEDNMRTSVSDVEGGFKVKSSQKESDERTSSGTVEPVSGSSQENTGSKDNLRIISENMKGVKEDKVSGDDSGVECGSDTPHTEEEMAKAATTNNQGDTGLSWKEGVNSQEHRTQCAFNFSNSVVFDLDVD